MGRQFFITKVESNPLEQNIDSASIFEAENVADDEMNWDAYAEHYDVMCDLNPSYQENVNRLLRHLAKWNVPAEARICDLGAGTGNYILALSDYLPDATFFHVDFDSKMNELAKRKYQKKGIRSFEIVDNYAQDTDFPEQYFDVVICVNALYAISPQEEVLTKISRWLKPEGKFFIIDFGRTQRTMDWTMYMFRESLKNQKVGQYVRALLNSRELIKQNKQTSKGQGTGRYWLHSTDEFQQTLDRCGFDVEIAVPCYRGYSDLAICHKKAS